MASTSGCSASSCSTAGIVSRVSPPAQSTGLLRLHRGGRWASIAAEQVVGQLEQLQVAVARDRVGGDHTPPAGGREHDHTRTFRQRLGGERGGGLERLLDARRPRDADRRGRRRRTACRRPPSAPVWLAAARAPPAVAPPFSTTSGLRAAASPSRAISAVAVAHGLDVRQSRPRSPGRRRRSRDSRRR